MAFGSKCVAKNRIPPHSELVQRIRKSLYFGDNFADVSVDVEENLTLPLATYASELFTKSHKGYSLNRLSAYNAGKIQANPCSLIMAVIFLERLNSIDPSYVRKITPQELFIVSMMISTKFYVGHDEEIYLSDWAAEGNMTDNRLKQLELEFLSAIDWNIYISNKEFFDKLDEVEKILACQVGLPRGWLTYTELVRLLPTSAGTTALLNALFNHIAVILVTYAAGFLTILGAFCLASYIPGHILHQSSMPATDPLNANMTELSVETHKNAELNSTVVVQQSATAVIKENSTCCAINTEAELIKLEQEYRQEEQRNRKSEMDTNALQHHNSLPYKQIKSQSRGLMALKKLETKWLYFKQMYSDDSCHLSKHVANFRQMNSTPEQEQERQQQQQLMTNITNLWSTFWQMLADKASTPANQPLVRLPHILLKFI